MMMMRAVSVRSNFLALFSLLSLSCVLYVWTGLDARLERHTRALRFTGSTGSLLNPDSPADLSVKTFRALLTVPAAQRLRSGGRPDVHNNRTADQSASLGSGDYRVNVNNNKGSAAPREPGPAIEDGIFWSAWLEDALPVGFSESHARAWRERARANRIVKLETGCGRTSNQLATFSDGTRACVRYGINPDQVQGETLTYYLAALLGVSSNLPPLALSRLDADQWAAVLRRRRTERGGGGLASWSAGAVVSLTEWVANLTGVVPPPPLRQESGPPLHPPLLLLRRNNDAGNASGTAAAELLELVQWSDLVVFDYLTANFDRLVSSLFSRQWDARVMQRDTNNLLRAPPSPPATHGGDRLVFLDNEAGLVHGYRVLDAWEPYHAAALASVCVFRRRTARRVGALHRGGDAGARLRGLYRDGEPLWAELGFLSEEHAGVLQRRIDRVYKHMLECKGRYGGL